MCGQGNQTSLQNLGDCYREVHGYVSLALCIYGVITNIINISILTKKSMINPINCLLTGIAVADMITMSSYIPFVIHFYILHSGSSNPVRNAYGWMFFLSVHLNLTLTSHTTSIWLGVIMAIMRFVIILNIINFLHTGIAVADMITMSSYIPFVIHFYILHSGSSNPVRNAYGWMFFLSVHLNLTLTSHTTSIWLGVIMAIMRFVIIRCSQARGAKSITIRTSILLILCTFGGAAFLVIPNYLITDLVPYPDPPNATLFWQLDSPIGKNGTDSMVITTFLVYPIAGKIIPIVLISVFGGLLLHTLWESDKRGRRLKGENSSSHQQNRRTTVMLLAIIVMYILSEVPQSVLVIMCVVDADFFRNVYMPLSDFIDLIALFNSAINFGMYCTMSRQFRNCLTDSVNACIKSCKKSPDSATSENTTLSHV